MWESMKMSLLPLTLAILFIVPSINGQENAQTRIPDSLTECYQNSSIFDREFRLPSTINMLVELIRKIEDTPGFNQDMRQLAVALVHRFRMDGIERAPGTFLPTVIPFSPIGSQFSRHRVLLTRLLPGNANQLPNGTLTTQERCALHFMMSSSTDRQVRNDEGTVCNQLAQLRSERIPRSVDQLPIPMKQRRQKRSPPYRNNFVGDVEVMEELADYHNRKTKKSGKLQMQDGVEGVEEEPTGTVDDIEISERGDGEGGDENGADEEIVDDDTLTDPDTKTLDTDATVIDTTNAAQSSCPVENGVVRTQWGAITAGTLIAGIAAGLQPEFVTTRDLLALSRRNGGEQQSSRQTAALQVDNRWAATLAGDLAEVALLQGPAAAQVQVGVVGGWNSTTVPRWYFVQQRDRLEMTDAEIRGGLDGLILALNVENYRNRAPTMRISQLIDMYYSQRGVFSSNIRSCDRRALFTEFAPLASMQAQTTAFSSVLDREIQLRVTLPLSAIQQFANAAAVALSTYIPQSLNDPTCATTSIEPRDTTIWRSAAQIYIYIDVSWTYRELLPVVHHLLDNIDVSRYGSTYTLLSANQASVIVNTTNSLADLFGNWTQELHQQQVNGLSLPNVFRSLRNLTRSLMEQERAQSSVGGQSKIALLIPNMGEVSEADNNFALQEQRIIREEVPDLTILFLSGGSAPRFERFVRDPRTDIFPLQVNANVPAAVNPLIQRIQQTPRRVINHRCGGDWWNTETGTNTMNQYVERGSVNFYRVHPNYFFRNTGNRRITVTGHGYGTVTVCTSRWIENPRNNMSTPQNDISCTQLTSQTHEIWLSNGCEGHFLISQCPPLFISVEGAGSTTEDVSFRCNDNTQCRFPDNIRFGITAENLGCFSGVAKIFATMALVFTAALFVVFSV